MHSMHTMLAPLSSRRPVRYVCMRVCMRACMHVYAPVCVCIQKFTDRNSISDLGVDTENLPKPKMVKTKIVNEEKLTDDEFCDSCESSLLDEKSIKVDPRNSLIKDSKA